MKDFIVEHLQKTLNPVSSLASGQDETGKAFPFHIGLIPDCPAEGATTLVTVGLSEKTLKQEDGTSIRHELLLCAHQDFGENVFAELMKVLGFVAKNILESGEAIASGDVIDLGQEIVRGSRLSAVFLFDPIYFPEASRSIENIDPPVAFAWAIPVTREEVAFIVEKGPDAFDALLREKDPDLMDLMRLSIV